MTDAALEIHGVTKRFRIPLDRSTTLKYRMAHWRSASRYDELLAVNDVSFDVPHGQFLGIIGHNGCGKSTLLKMLAGIYAPTLGKVLVNGTMSPFLELGVGFNPELTARENIYLNGAILGILRRDIDRRIDAIFDFAGLRHRADDKIKNYSSGMQVRLAFSVAIQANADILLMDEVLAVGDANFQSKCFDVFANYRRQGRTVVLVTHDLGSVDRHCDRAIWLDGGRLVADGPPAEVTSSYRRRVGQQIDEEAMAAPPPNILLAPGSRWGSGELEISDVSLTDDRGRRHHTFTSGKSMRMVIEVKVNRRVDDHLVCGIGIHASDGQVIAGTNTHICGMSIACPPEGEKLMFEYTIDDLSLLGGRYTISVDLASLSDWSPYDHHEKVYDFEVSDETGRAGYVEMGGTWMVDSPESYQTVTEAAPATGESTQQRA